MDGRQQTVVINLLDDRTITYDSPPDWAVVKAFEENEKGVFDVLNCLNPSDHPHFKAYRRGYACGDWVAYKGKSAVNPFRD
jgi:hypothetical protein